MGALHIRTDSGARRLPDTLHAVARHALNASVGAVALGVVAIALPSHAQVSPPVMHGRDSGQPVTPADHHVDARGVSCQELKARIRDAGSLFISSGPQGGDMFHARTPQCEFWQRAQFTNARAKDGWCAVGYVCVAKMPP